jgi:hypothetical protein
MASWHHDLAPTNVQNPVQQQTPCPRKRRTTAPLQGLEPKSPPVLASPLRPFSVLAAYNRAIGGKRVDARETCHWNAHTGVNPSNINHERCRYTDDVTHISRRQPQQQPWYPLSTGELQKVMTKTNLEGVSDEVRKRVKSDRAKEKGRFKPTLCFRYNSR